MELFIRTQDKHQLLKVCSLSLTYEDENTKIICYDNNDKAWVIGFYETKERALEVLDEIQGKLRYYGVVSDAYTSNHTLIVYEMPEN